MPSYLKKQIPSGKNLCKSIERHLAKQESESYNNENKKS